MLAPTNLTAVESKALSALAAGGRVANLLSPGGATSAAVGDILAAAGEVVSLINTVDSALATFTSPINDPIGSSFSSGQPYGGTFITSPTVTQLTPVNFNQTSSSSTQNLSQLSSAQQAALSARTGVTLTTDADLATAMATLFSQTQANAKLAFSIDLTDTSAIVPPTTTTNTPTSTVTIPPLTRQPDVNALSNFISQVVGSFPNTPGIAGVAASIWVDGLGVSVDSTGAPITGIPSGISSGIYADITGSASGMTGATPVTIVDYSQQQNQFNLVVALAIDNGLIGTFTSLLGTSMTNSATTQVIKNRLSSVAQRGDAAMLSAMFTALGVNNIPSAVTLITSLLTSLNPSDQSGGALPTITASGIPLTTTTTPITTTALIAFINAMLALVGTTIQAICSQNTCNSVFCSQTLLNAPMIRAINRKVITELLGSTVVEMAYMF